jgi:hypothetical protein
VQRGEFPCWVWLKVIEAAVDPAEIRRHWNVKETPVLDALLTPAPALYIGTVDAFDLVGPVARMIEHLGYIGTTPDYVLPVIDEDLIAELLRLRQPTPAESEFEVADADELEAFLRGHLGLHVVCDERPPIPN